MVRPVTFALVIGACGSPPHVSPDAANEVDATSDAAPVAITGRDVLRVVQFSDATRVPSVADMPWDMLALSAQPAGGEAQAVSAGADGNFAFTVPTLPYALTIAEDTNAPATFDGFDSARIDLGERLIGRYDRAPVPAGTKLAVTITGTPPPSGTAILASTGLWTQTLRNNGTNMTFSVDWTLAGSVSGPIGLLDSAAFDRAYWVVIDNISSPAYLALTYACAADVKMTAGASTPMTCAAAALPQSHCTHLRAGFAAEAARVTAALPSSPAFATASSSWAIVAVPSPTLGPVGGLFIARGDLGANPADVDRNITYGVPYPGHDVAVQMAVVRSRSIALGSASATTQALATVHYVKAAADCTTSTDLAGSIAMASLPTLDGVELGTDNLTLGLDHEKPHVLAWDVAAPGIVDYWTVRLWQLSAPTGATRADVRHSWVTTQRSITIDPALLASGATYFVDILADETYANAASGDFYNVTYPARPYAYSQVPSGTFQVTD